ncbi:SirB2 family protein [Kangiella sp. TOML190]|uniref:SirB2 family protein n=1 Tax=Kangiella sp. TOML190 TaxID=2931351 RepID=UPI00203C304A|nr:SirB2 family protein [Kangiella sp. TOML190]
MYPAIKHLHMTLAMISILGFMLRAVWLFSQSSLLHKKPVKILPHIIDTLLLASGITLMVITTQYPAILNWVTLKLVFIVCYIVFGILTFKAQAKNKQILFFLLAIGTVFAVLHLAFGKPVY